MEAYLVTDQSGKQRLRWVPSSAKLTFAPYGVDFPFITYSREIAEQLATEHNGKVKPIK